MESNTICKRTLADVFNHQGRTSPTYYEKQIKTQKAQQRFVVKSSNTKLI